MKRLTLLRHAKSSWDDPQQRDFDRPLNARGRRAAVTMGTWMRDRELTFDLVLASPAVRVVETLAGVTKGLGRELDVRFEGAIYAASLGALLDLIGQVDDRIGEVLLVGHNPGLQELLLHLTHDASAGLRAKAAAKYPTAALAVIGLPVAEWLAIRPGEALLETFVTPRDLEKS
jgi:phosphohistidine phosphatase